MAVSIDMTCFVIFGCRKLIGNEASRKTSSITYVFLFPLYLWRKHYWCLQHKTYCEVQMTNAFLDSPFPPDPNLLLQSLNVLSSADVFLIGNQRETIKSKISNFLASWKHLKTSTSSFQPVDIFLLLWPELSAIFQVSSSLLLCNFCSLGNISDATLNSSRQK